MSPRTPPGINHDIPFTPRTPRYGPLGEPDAYSRKGRSIRSAKKRERPMDDLKDIQGNHLLTPEETPARKRQTDMIMTSRIAASTARVLFPSGSSAAGQGRSYGHTSHHENSHLHSHSHVSSAVPVTPKKKLHSVMKTPVIGGDDTYEDPPSTPPIRRSGVQLNLSSPRVHPDFEIFSDKKALIDELTDSQASHSHSHPHLPPADNTPGMWYVFRGKKVFRPFPKDEPFIDIKPKKLFADELAQDSSVSGLNSEEDDTDVEEDRKPTSRDFFVRKKTKINKTV